MTDPQGIDARRVRHVDDENVARAGEKSRDRTILAPERTRFSLMTYQSVGSAMMRAYWSSIIRTLSVGAGDNDEWPVRS